MYSRILLHAYCLISLALFKANKALIYASRLTVRTRLSRQLRASIVHHAQIRGGMVGKMSAILIFNAGSHTIV